MRVLIVEDEQLVAELFRDHLIELGHVPVLAKSAEDGLRLIDTEDIDAAIVDLYLAGMSGLEFLKLPAVRERMLSIVVVSGRASETEMRECLRLGALDFVQKPIPLPRLTEAVGFLELHVLNAHLVDQVRRLDRRRYPRVPVVFPVRVMEYRGVEWLGMAIDLSPFGLRLRADAPLDEGAAVKLHFTPSDGPPSVTLLSVLVRAEADELAFNFVNLTRAEFHRLSAIVQVLAGQPPPAEGRVSRPFR
jgi:DNA-binding response OmpR family regulator